MIPQMFMVQFFKTSSPLYNFKQGTGCGFVWKGCDCVYKVRTHGLCVLHRCDTAVRIADMVICVVYHYHLTTQLEKSYCYNTMIKRIRYIS